MGNKGRAVASRGGAALETSAREIASYSVSSGSKLVNITSTQQFPRRAAPGQLFRGAEGDGGGGGGSADHKVEEKNELADEWLNNFVV